MLLSPRDPPELEHTTGEHLHEDRSPDFFAAPVCPVFAYLPSGSCRHAVKTD
jgi:hypothetical protein